MMFKFIFMDFVMGWSGKIQVHGHGLNISKEHLEKRREERYFGKRKR